MADGEWESVEDAESQSLEGQRDSATGALPGHNRSPDEGPWGPPDPRSSEEQRKVIETYSKLDHDGVGESREVTHTCNQCDETHTDTYSEPVPFPTDEEHAGSNNWGSRTGSRFSAVHVTGKMVRRTEIQGRKPESGGDMSEPYALRHSWEKSTIDHIEQRPYIEWNALAPVDCIHGVHPRYVTLLRDEDWEASALTALLFRRQLVGAGLSFIDAASVLAEVTAFTKNPEAPIRTNIRIESRAVSIEFVKGGEEAGTLELEIHPETSSVRTKAWNLEGN